MFEARLFSYGEVPGYRLGVNFNHIRVKAPKCPSHSFHRDGAIVSSFLTRRVSVGQGLVDRVCDADPQ
ncbi:hypothetical protein LMG28138_06054 [Pararobbsia alpina]|uniref:Catalase core domain-containing protein n=2 Tax=Pararobbsia alpina TaxID=621374 RepID=A0A6S7CFX2_9BURK|nr:hypothetical protein LMG28138_06054 [Pararobbsia alpina]